MKVIGWILAFLCGAGISAAAADSTVTFTDSKKTVMLLPDHARFTITLKSNPTTGYSWVVRRYNSRIIKPVGHQYHAPNSKLLGAPGYETFEFKASHKAFNVPQKTYLTLEYVRPWEAKVPGAETLTFTIITSGKKS